MSVLNQYVAIAEEAVASYGTAGTAFREYESDVDGFSRDTDYIMGGGRRRAASGTRSDRRRKVDLGATGRIESVFLTKGEGLRLKNALGAITAPAVVVAGATAAYRQVYKGDVQGPRASYTVNVARARDAAAITYFQYLGAMATGFDFSVEEGGKLIFGVDYDCRSESVLGAVPANPTVPDGGEMFIWEDCSLMVGGAASTVFKSFELSCDLMMDTERYFLQDSNLKDKPIRDGIPTYEGTLSGEFQNTADYDRFVSGEIFAIEFLARYPEAIETVSGTAYYPELKITLPACQYSGSTPESSLDSLSTIELPFVALSDDMNEICNIEYISTDTAA